MAEYILKEISVLDEIISVVCDRMNPDDRISDALLREAQDCINNIRQEINEHADA